MMTGKFKLLVFFVVTLVFTGIPKCLPQGSKIIKACVSEQLEIPCQFDISRNPTFVALWVKTAEHIQGLNMTTMTFECNKGHRFYQQCLLQMNNSTYYTNDKVYFMFNKLWPGLNQSSVWCFTRNSNGTNDNISEVATKIDMHPCQDQNEATTPTSTPPVSVSTDTTTASQPNVPCPDVAKTSSDKHSTEFVVAMCLVCAIVGAVLARAPDIYHCYMKYRRRDVVPNDGAPNGNTRTEDEQTSKV